MLFAIKRHALFATVAILSVFGIVSTSAHALVLNEISYHSEDLDDGPVEWIELFNERLDPLDLTGYSICNGVSFEFPRGTMLLGYEYLIVCADVAAFEAKYTVPEGTRVLGGWTGSLANNGEKLEVCLPGGVERIGVRYNDRGKWPVAADGTGHTLSLIDPYTDNSDADGWTFSIEPGGTPGEHNGHRTESGSTGFSVDNNMDGSGFLVGWLLLGPYTGAACNTSESVLRSDYLRGSTTPREEDLEWRDDQVVNTNYSSARSTGLLGGGTPRVDLYQGVSDTIDLNAIYPGDPNNVMAYAFVYVDNVTDSNLPVTIAVASDDAINVMVNGSDVMTRPVCRGVGGGGSIQDRANATLEPGKNLIAVKVFEASGGWAFRLRLEERNNQTAITSKAVIQVMTDVDAGLDFDGNGEPLYELDDGGPGGPGEGDSGMVPTNGPVVINEALLNTAGDRWVELFNRSADDIDLSDYYLTDDATDLTKVQLVAGTTLPGDGYLDFTESELGLDFELTELRDRLFLALVAPDGVTVVDAFNFENKLAEMSEARVPDGDREFDDGADPTRGAANTISPITDLVINEIMYNPIDDNTDKEYVELFNRGESAVDLTGWSLSGINFDFPDGASVASGAYLVVARNPQFIADLHGLEAGVVIGPAQDLESLDRFGTLRDSGERVTLKDELGRTADTVRYVDGGEWSRWADGHGSSLELIDPLQDNRIPAAWDASDDSAKAPVGEFSYVGVHGNGAERELHMILLNRGITVVDDVTIHSGSLVNEDVEYVAKGSTWKLFKGTEEPPVDWAMLGFNDAAWIDAEAEIGYGENDQTTTLDDMEDGYVTIFLRQEFEIADVASIPSLLLDVKIDDGFVAYLNGEFIGSFGVTDRAFDSPAALTVDNRQVELDITGSRNLLNEGTNVLAFQVHNRSLSNSDLSFDASLVSRTVLPGAGAVQHVVNGTFNSNTSRWAIEGNHIRSGRTTVDPISGSGSLKIVANGRGDNKVNRIETDNSGLSPTLPGTGNLLVRFKARWVAGSPSLLTHGYEHGMARSHKLLVPENLGTPGRINSVTERQIAAAGGNLGPVITDVQQNPPQPEASEDVTVRARVLDSDGVAEVRLFHRNGSPSSTMSSRVMNSIGGDWYEATIPGQSNGTKVVYYVHAEDTEGVVGRYPIDIVERTHPLSLSTTNPPQTDRRYLLYRHNQRDAGTPYHSYRFWLSDLVENQVNSRRRQSNDMVRGSFVFGGERIYQESFYRFSGSPFARSGWGGSARIRMPRGDELHGIIRKMNVDEHHGNGRNAKERTSHYLFRQQNGGGTVVPFSDVSIVVRFQVNDRASGVLEHGWVPDQQFLDLWFPGNDDGSLFEVDDRFVINDSGGRVGNTNAELRFPPPSSRSDGDGNNKENYRWFFGLRTKNGADDFSELIDFAEIMDPSRTNATNFDNQIFEVCNVEEFLRIWAVRLNTDDWDQWGASRGKNCYIYRTSGDLMWNLLGWDMELTYGNPGAFGLPSSPDQAYNPGRFTEVNRMFNRPKVKRMYYAIMNEMVNGPDAWFTSSYLSPYMTALADIGMSNTNIGQPGGFIDSRRNHIRPRIQGAFQPAVGFSITTNSGRDFEVDDTETNLAGTAPADICDIVVTRSGGEGESYPVRFTTMRNWTMADVPLDPGDNEFTLFGFDLRGNLVDDDSITITSTAIVLPPPVLTSVDPTTAFPGETIELSGDLFLDGIRVFFGDERATDVTIQSEQSLSVVVPVGSGEVSVRVHNLGSDFSEAVQFFYPPPPVLLSINPGLANPGDIIEVEGSGFAEGVRVFFGGTESPSVELVNSTSLRVEVPGSDDFAPVDVIAMNTTEEPSNTIEFSFPPSFVRGDVNRDDRVDLADGISVLLLLYSGLDVPCDEAADTNNDDELNLTDAIHIMNWLFKDGPSIAAPFPTAGLDLDGDAISCEL